MTNDQFIEALYQCDFPQGDMGRPAIDFYRAMLNRLMGISLHPPSHQDLYDMLQGGFADANPDHDQLMREWEAIVPHLREDAGDLGVFLVERIEWEEDKGAAIRAEMNAQMGMGGPGLPANVEPASILAGYGALCKDQTADEDDEDEDSGDGEEEMEDVCEWTDLVLVFHYGSMYE